MKTSCCCLNYPCSFQVYISWIIDCKFEDFKPFWVAGDGSNKSNFYYIRYVDLANAMLIMNTFVASQFFILPSNLDVL